LSSPKWPLY